jgi:hypothetical protein
MTPRDVDQLTDVEFAAFDAYMDADLKEQEREARKLKARR